jgi:ribosome-associated toxin RatA of RatAB toxin-antitoxin module
MKIIEKKIIYFDAQTIFEWINDIDAYKYEVPWCVDSGIIEQKTPTEVRGFLTMQLGPFKRQIVTDNTLSPYSRVSMSLVSGPFSLFEGQWLLREIDTQMTEVELFLEICWSEPWLEALAKMSYHGLRLKALEHLERRLLNRKRI